jgi:hypothetical protein
LRSRKLRVKPSDGAGGSLPESRGFADRAEEALGALLKLSGLIDRLNELIG